MKKGKGKQIITLLLACVMVFMPTASYAADGQDSVRYVSDENGKHIGIESAIFDGMTYYDIYDGKSEGRTDLAAQVQFLMDAVEKEYEGESLLSSWAELAYAIYAANWDYASGTCLEEPLDFIREYLSSPDSHYDITYNPGYGDEPDTLKTGTGLQYATSLSAVKDKVCEIATEDGIDIWTSHFGGTYDDRNFGLTKDRARSYFDDNNMLSCLDDDSYGPVLYSIADYTVGTQDSKYRDLENSIFGIALYDIQLQVMANDELQYITAADDYGDVETAANNGASGVTYRTNTSGGDNRLSYFQNRTASEADVGMEFTQSDSLEASNSMEKTSTYEYSSMIGSETKLGVSIKAIVNMEETFKSEFTTSEVLSTAYSESTSVKKETSTTSTATKSLPAQTAVSIESSSGTTNASLEYDCPVALTYKVAVFSVSPYWEDHSHANYPEDADLNISSCNALSTVFGCEYETGGLDAVSNLYNRAITYHDLTSYDASYGQVYGNYRNGSKTINYLNWNDILNGVINAGDLTRDTEPIYLERYEVNMDGDTATQGKQLARNLYANGYLGYETSVEVNSTFIKTDDDGNQISYTLYDGPVYDANGNDLNADLKAGSSSNTYTKSVTPTSDTTCTAKFYYIKDETSSETEASSESESESEQSESQSESDQIETTALSSPAADETEAVIAEEEDGEAESQEEENNVIAEPETVPETVAEAEEAAEDATEPEETTVAEETANPAEITVAEETAEPIETETFVEESAALEETVDIAEYDLTTAAEEIAGTEETAEPVEAEVYEAPADSYEDEVIIEDGDLIGSVSNGGTVAGIDSNGSSAGNESDEPKLTIESIEVVESAEIPEDLLDGEDAAAEETPESTDIMPMSSDVMTLANIEGVNDDVIWIVTHKPMSVTGSTLALTGETTTSEIYGMVPIYPLDYIAVTSDQKTFDMISGTTLNVDNIEIDGFNENNVSYYGFDQKLGSWMITDVDGNELSDSTVASLETDPATGETLLTAEDEGTVYLKYMIDEKATNYSDMNGSDPATNDDLSSTAMVKINVAKGPFYGTVIADGTLTGYANETDDDYERVYINLDTCDTIGATVYDETDKMLSNPAITWEAQETEEKGIIIENDQLYFTEPGTYHIRAIYGYSTINSNPYSDWIEVTALPEKVLDELTIEDITDPATLSDIILGDGYETINLGWLDVSAIDQYELDWTKFDKLKWYVDGVEVEPNDAGSYLYTATEAGDHIIYAQCTDPDGKYDVKSNELTLTVYPERELDSLVISDTASPATLEEFIYGDGKESVDLAELTIVSLDQYGDEWEDLRSLTWYVDGEAIDGSVYIVTEGTHTIYAECADDEDKYDVKSNELTLSVLPARKLNSLQISDTTSPKTLAEVTYGEGKENVDLSKLKITALDQYGDTWTDLNNLKWYVDDQALSGTVYTVKDTSAGTHSIYAQCDGVKSNKLSISVKVPATSVKLNKETLEIKDGKTKQLTATMAPTGTTDTVTWTSSNKKVATVSADGTVTAVSAGTATITAKTTSGKTATCQVHTVYKKNETFTKGSYKYIVKDASTDGTGEVYMNGFAKGKSKKKLTVPDTVTVNGTTYKVTAIANEAFKGNKTIKSVTTGKNLTTIGKSAFENCQSLKTVTIGNSVKKINFKAFYDCYNLKTLSIGKNVNFMGAHCFCNDSKLKTITIKTTKLKKKNVESPHVFINVNKATMKVPKSKYSSYKKLFTNRYYGGKITK